jgi:hypothetical protein
MSNTPTADVHARLAPSSSKIWMNCTAQPDYIAANAHRVPLNTDSEYSILGTKQHDWNAKYILGLVKLDDIPSAHRSWAQKWKEETDRVVAHGPGQRYVEEKTPLWYSGKDEKGTVDFAYITETCVYVLDYKHGVGVPVDPEGNTQLSIYALSLIEDLDAMGLYQFANEMPVIIRVVQPRYRGEEPVKTWNTTVGELYQMKLEIDAKVAIQTSKKNDLKVFAPSEDVCRWCPAKGFCEHKIAAPLAELPASANPLEVFSNLASPAPAEITDAQLLNIYANGKAIKKIIDDVEEYLAERARRGNPVKGTKLVWGRKGNRKWANPDAVITLCKNKGIKMSDIMEYELKSPTKVQELDAVIRAMEASPRFLSSLEACISRAEASPSLALSTDKRSEINADTFKNLEQMEEEP